MAMQLPLSSSQTASEEGKTQSNRNVYCVSLVNSSTVSNEMLRVHVRSLAHVPFVHSFVHSITLVLQSISTNHIP